MKVLVFTFTLLISLNIKASIFCHTPRMNKIFEVSDKKVTFFNEFENEAKREIASIIPKSKPSTKGITKFVDFENQRHVIHIGDKNNFSDVNDYIIIKSKTGHEVTYPLTCENK